jgi:arylsulfatase A-like enzyme
MATRRQFLGSLLAAPLGGQRASPPNIVILLADDLGWADVGCHGSEIRTPNIDRLASQGMQLDRFYAFPLCSPTRSALMTARSPIRLGIVYATVEPFDSHGVPVEEHFFSQSLKEAGYETAMAGKWHLGHTHLKFLPNSRGFDHSYGCLNGRIDYYTKDREGGYDWHRDGKTVREEGYSTEQIGRVAARLIRSRDRRKPLFLYVPFNAPHMPLHAPPKFIDDYAGVKDDSRRAFCAMTAYLDSAVGQILGAIDDEGLRENTIVLFFSDNGGPTQSGARNTPLRGGKRTAFEGGIRVPAVLRWPARIKPGSRSAQVATVLDLFPTLCAAAGVTPRNRLPLDGKNVWASIASGKAEPREDLFFGTGSGSKFLYSVLHGEWKLVREISRKDGRAANYLFRIADDPEEKSDLAAGHPDLVRELARKIDRWRAMYPRDASSIQRRMRRRAGTLPGRGRRRQFDYPGSGGPGAADRSRSRN